MFRDMKPNRCFGILTLLIACVTAGGLWALNSYANGGAKLDEASRKKLWAEVEKAQQEGLPKTAIEKLQLIYDDAMGQDQLPEAIKALAAKFMAEGSIDQPVLPNVIRKLEAAIPETPVEIRPVMKALLADWYFSYFQQNRWRFAQRSQTSEAPSEDFETWDLPRFLNHVDALYREVLADAQVLKSIQIGEYKALLSDSTVSDVHRPTLYDFVAFEALKFYELDEQIVRQQDAFDLRADSPVFSSNAEFLAWEPKSKEGDSFLLEAVKLYQDLLRFHAEDADKTAFLDADLHRLQFGNLAAVGSEATVRFQVALQRFADENQTHSLSAMALAKLSDSLYQEGEAVKAHKAATIGLGRFNDSLGGRMCFNLLQQIEARELQVQTERVWNSAKPTIEIAYRNLDNVYFRLVEFDYNDWKWGEYREPSNMEYQDRLKLVAKPTVAAWQVELKRTEDYKQAYHQAVAKYDVKPGCYLLLASANEDFSSENNQLSTTEVWVSNLAILLQDNYEDPELKGQVLDALTGLPIAEAKVSVHAWAQDGRNSSEKEVATLRTDVDGFFRVKRIPRSSYRVVASSGDQSLGIVDQQGYYRSNRGNDISKQAIFFTDRSIYRPGQTIQFKGVLFSSNQSRNDYTTVANRKAKVGLWDVNNQLVEQLELTSNEFGSISGSFTAPKDRATGQMRIGTIESEFDGSQWLRVEEYKRPKFYVEVEKPVTQYQLNQEVVIKGKASAYTGAAIDGAKVTWRVVRQVRYPAWWMSRCWYCPPSNGQMQEIANGSAVTQVDGTFTVPFTAVPDQSVDRESQPVFTYTVYADVTDTTGETRSSSTYVRLGYTSLQASLSVEGWLVAQKATLINSLVTTLDGNGQAVTGTLSVFALKAPDTVQRGELAGLYSIRQQVFSNLFRNGGRPDSDSIKPDRSQIDFWELGELVSTVEAKTDGAGKAISEISLAAGAYRAKFETVDATGNKIQAEETFLVLDPTSDNFSVKIPRLLQAETWKVQPGEEFSAIWGTGYQSGQAYVQWVHRGKVIQAFWTDPSKTQSVIKFTPTQKHRGGLSLLITFVKENRCYTEVRRVDVPWTEKKLDVKWERFVSKLTPGGKETWTAIISGPGTEKAIAEMVGTLYDASLDAFAPHVWQQAFQVFYQDYSPVSVRYSNQMHYLQAYVNNWPVEFRDVSFSYRQFAAGLVLNDWSARSDIRMRKNSRALPSGGMGGGFSGEPMAMAMESRSADSAMDTESYAFRGEGVAEELGGGQAGEQPGSGPEVDLSQVSARKNLQETAFFFPTLKSDKDGVVRLEFEVPEALTEWKFMGFAHDAKLRSGFITDKAVTSKDLMVQPNPPRFLREGDLLEFSVKVSNQSPTQQTGKVRLSFTDLQSGESMDSALGNQQNELVFEIPAGQSKSLYWTIKVPDFVGVLGYKVVGATDRLSDGEEGFLPVLSKRLLVTESIPLPIRGKQTKEFTFESLLNSGDSDSLKSQTLTVQMTSNPSWYAVMALPYLMEYPHECSEQVFNRLYANSLAKHIVDSDDRIKQVFAQWRATDALDSPLEKNQDIRNVLIEQSPWLQDAKEESQARRNVGVLFDDNRLKSELTRSADKLAQMQYSDGAWPWFPGGQANDYITLYVTTGFGRLRHLGADVDVSPAIKSLDRLDNWVEQTYQRIVEQKGLDNNHLSATICMYLYGRSFFLQDKPIDPAYKPAVDYFLAQGKTNWVKLGDRQPQGHLAIALKRFGDLETPKKIMASLTERSLSEDEMGMFWRESAEAWWWYRAPIETQALMIEAYDEIMDDQPKVEDLKVWLLKQKQTQNWKTTKATADAVYALLLRGTSQLASRELVTVQLGGVTIKPTDTQTGTGFYQERFVRGEIKAEMANIVVSKKDEGVAWGSVHWQYLEDVAKIKPYQGTPLTLKKSLYVKKNTEKGPVIQPIKGAVNVGDEVVVRVELRTDRDMEYVHLKDYRGSGTEPVNVLSQYKFQDGLYYYESTKDTASHFFIDYLPRGVYVFEYSVRVQHRGTYQTGIAEFQCMYAPEFNSHSESISMEVE